jgi:carbamate kinase
MIGYWLTQALRNALPGREAVALITQTVVRADDPGFTNPTKFVGRGYDEAEAKKLAEVGGWTIRQDGERWRRVVASPEPVEVVELTTIETLISANTVVVCAGGGGVPVVRDALGHLHGVEAVIDKDLATSLLARLVGADLLLFLTDVPNVFCDFGTALQGALSRVCVADLRKIPFPAGSMGPKVEAACRFVETTGGRAVVGSLDDVEGLLAGTSGTSVVAS